MKTILHILGSIWALPCSLLSYIAIGLLMLFKQHSDVYDYCGDTVFVFRTEGWFYKTFFEKRGFIGFTFGTVIFVAKFKNLKQCRQTIHHEKRHCQHFMALGVLFPIVWFLESVRVYLFCKNKHSYYDNWFEKDARKYAGQQVEIPRDQWLQGEDDRWVLW